VHSKSSSKTSFRPSAVHSSTASQSSSTSSSSLSTTPGPRSTPPTPPHLHAGPHLHAEEAGATRARQQGRGGEASPIGQMALATANAHSIISFATEVRRTKKRQNQPPRRRRLAAQPLHARLCLRLHAAAAKPPHTRSSPNTRKVAAARIYLMDPVFLTHQAAAAAVLLPPMAAAAGLLPPTAATALLPRGSSILLPSPIESIHSEERVAGRVWSVKNINELSVFYRFKLLCEGV
jgi:hypothetical protein